MGGRTISSAPGNELPLVLARRLATAVLLLHKEGGLTPVDYQAWEAATGSHVITIAQVRELAHAVLDSDQAAAR